LAKNRSADGINPEWTGRSISARQPYSFDRQISQSAGFFVPDDTVLAVFPSAVEARSNER
jgi:hypothetical protein